MPSPPAAYWEGVLVTWARNVALLEINSKAYNNEQGLLGCGGLPRTVDCCTEANT